jgi:hypothetical protein
MTRETTTCQDCGRERAIADDLQRFRSVTPDGNPYAMAPSTWQLVRLGVCLPFDESHLDIPADLLAVCWAFDYLRCKAPRAAS